MIFLLQGKNNVFETELFMPIINKVKEMSKLPNDASLRIIADHLRASALLVCDGVVPSNLGQGYILRRLIRRCIRHLRKVEFDVENIEVIIDTLIDSLKEMYPELEKNRENVIYQIKKEKNRFMNTLVKGEKNFIKLLII